MQPHEATGSAAGAGLLSLYLSNCNQFIDNDGSGSLRQRSDPSVIGLLSAMAERENALREKNAAIAEKKRALTERENALMQRDVAYAERDSAIMDRDRAVTALNIARAEREACPHCSNWVRQSAPQKIATSVNVAESRKFTEAIASITTAEMPQGTTTPVSQVDQSKKRKRNRKTKETPKQESEDISAKNNKAIVPSNSSVTSKKVKNSQLENQRCSEESKFQLFSQNKDSFGDHSFLNGSVYDHMTIPSPYCSCTGMNQQCYRWGTGGWQSACCTNQISMHPLPMNPKKKSCRVAGRKMSAGAFGRLLERLASEGWDISTPVDLKEYWSKHGTNRYVTIK